MIPLHTESGCSAVGSALRSGRRGRQFESGHPDNKKGSNLKWSLPFLFAFCQVFCLAGAGPVPVRNTNGNTHNRTSTNVQGRVGMVSARPQPMWTHRQIQCVEPFGLRTGTGPAPARRTCHVVYNTCNQSSTMPMSAATSSALTLPVSKMPTQELLPDDRATISFMVSPFCFTKTLMPSLLPFFMPVNSV